MVLGTIICPMGSLGDMEALCRGRRGESIDIRPLEGDRAAIRYRLPLAEVPKSSFYCVTIF